MSNSGKRAPIEGAGSGKLRTRRRLSIVRPNVMEPSAYLGISKLDDEIYWKGSH